MNREDQRASRIGLTSEEAEDRLKQFGENVIRESGRKPPWRVFLEQFEDLLVIILIIAAVISTVSGDAESTIVILAVITMNAVLGTVQHEKAQKSLDSLKRMTSPEARVMRDGQIVQTDSALLVPGDVMLLETGDLVVADGRLLESFRLQSDESTLTGESEPIEKEKKDMVYSGALVTSGRGLALVTATGMETELGKIAAMMNRAGERRTPLQVSMDQFSSRLAAGILVICTAVFGLSLYRGDPLLDSLMFSVALAVAAIPEALGSIVTIVQAMGTQQMAKEHAIIKDLKVVESLGCVSVICSDKTGTLTQNRMTVQSVFADGREVLPEQLDAENPMHGELLCAVVLDNDARPGSPGTDQRMLGDPMETALAMMAARAGVDAGALQKQYPRLAELAFDSDRKRMSTLHRIGGRTVMFTKGAPDLLLKQSAYIRTSAGTLPMRTAQQRKILEKMREWSECGIRMLAFACREWEDDSGRKMQTMQLDRQTETNLTWLGLTAMTDPPRPESYAAVAAARSAGIRTVMITGDHKATAVSIARQIGIFCPGDEAVTGMELERMTDGELFRRLERISVYARVTPAHKIRIVEAWQRRGDIVAMSGDGVNDAPALKKADIGIAMGLSGTEVSRDAASMILTDDNFATIIKAVSNGRNVYRNICHAIEFLLSGNMAGILCVLYTTVTAQPEPFLPVHLLFINLLTDSLPAIAIGMEPQEAELLRKPPRNPQEGILTGRFLRTVMSQGALIAVCTMAAYSRGLAGGGVGTACTMAFSTLTLARLFHGFNCRSEQPLSHLGLTSNMWTVMAFESGVVLLAAVLFLPGLQMVFEVADLSREQFVTVGILAFLPTMIIQAVKMIRTMVKFS